MKSICPQPASLLLWEHLRKIPKKKITLLRNSPPSKNWSSQEKSGSARKGFFIENKTTHRVLTCEVSELRYFNAWQPRIPAKSTCGGYAVELVLGSTLVNVLV